jgi:hypothetical protein
MEQLSPKTLDRWRNPMEGRMVFKGARKEHHQGRMSISLLVLMAKTDCRFLIT